MYIDDEGYAHDDSHIFSHENGILAQGGKDLTTQSALKALSPLFRILQSQEF